VTLTLAELYVRQGLIGRAREIYRRLADAGDETARRRLSELPSAEGKIAALRICWRGCRRGAERGGIRMAFKEDLEQICGKVDGSFAASVMGFDGIPIETHEVRPPDGVRAAKSPGRILRHPLAGPPGRRALQMGRRTRSRSEPRSWSRWRARCT